MNNPETKVNFKQRWNYTSKHATKHHQNTYEASPGNFKTKLKLKAPKKSVMSDNFEKKKENFSLEISFFFA